MSRIGTYGAQSFLVSQSMLIQKRIYDVQLQLSSEYKAQDYKGLHPNAKQLIDLENARKRLEAQKAGNEQADLKLKMMDNALTSIEKVVRDFKNELVAFSDDLTSPMTTEKQADIAALQQAAFEAMQEMAGMLNTDHNGDYMFGGGKTDRPPVRLTDTSGNTIGSLSAFQTVYDGIGQTYPTTRQTAMDASAAPAWHQPYYNGDQLEIEHRVSDDRSVKIGINASDPAFEKAFRALGVIAQGDLANNPSRVQEALRLVRDSLSHDEANSPNENASDMTSLQKRIGLARLAISRAQEQSEQAMLYFDQRIGDIEGVNKAEAAARLQIDMSALEISYSAIGRMSGLSLTNYL